MYSNGHDSLLMFNCCTLCYSWMFWCGATVLVLCSELMLWHYPQLYIIKIIDIYCE